jgi:hypothetical protein
MATVLFPPAPRQPSFTRSFKLAALICAALSLGRGCSAEAAPNPELERTLDAIRQVESSGGRNHRDGDHGRAHGEYQIHLNFWTDGTRFLGVSWAFSDAHDPAKARRVVRAYLLGYQRAGGYPAIPETWARIQNGGPEGPRKAGTLKYYQKVKATLRPL